MSSVDYFFDFALSLLGIVAAGAVAQSIGVRATLVIGSALTGLTTLIPLLPGVNDPESPNRPADPRRHSAR